MPPNTPATHQANLLYHANVVHGPHFYPHGNVGYNVWTPSVPGLNHSWHMNNLHNGNMPGQGPTLLQSMMSSPYKRNLLPYQNAMLHNAVSPVQNTYGMMRGNIFQIYPPHLPMWQRYQRVNPGFRYLALSTPPSVREQLGMMRRPGGPGQGPGPFPFSAEGSIGNPFDASLNGMPRSTLQRVGNAVGGFLGRRGPQQAAGFPSVPATGNFPEGEQPVRAPETRERAEAMSMLLALRQEIQKFINATPELLPASQRAIGMLVASMDASMSGPELSRNHALSAQMFWESIVALDRQERGEEPPATVPEPEPGE